MQRNVRVGTHSRMAGSARVAAIVCTVLLGALMSGCPARGIGDPCVPEAIPGDGFVDREIYVETSSVQCRTRTCMVFRLQGNPTQVIEDGTCPDGSLNCVSRDLDVTVNNSLDRVFCSCRCSAAGGDANTPLCECSDGFHCVDVISAGGAGVQGGYCVPNELCTSDDDCANGCNLTTGVCNPAS